MGRSHQSWCGSPSSKSCNFGLTRNYISGSIPPQWGSMQSLRIISLLGNLVTGQIPIELANITTLEELVLEANQINGTIPSELGNLPNIRRLVFNSNNLTGELPASLAQLTSLGEFRISGNNFRGSIPDYIQNWTNITRIEIQGSGLTGPIPSNLTSLTNLLYLRISDLNGSPSNFSHLSLSFFQSLILRSCNLVGEIPPFIGDMTIDELDLSFNNLTGQIPRNLADNLTGIIYLTGNSLNGTVPTFKTRKIVDLSYNTFTTESTSQCGDNSPNLFAKSKENNTATFNCVKQRNCNSGDDYHSFYINCGGGREGDYEDDIGESSEFDEGLNWGYRNTGTFMDDTPEYGSFISKSNFSISGPVSQLYKDARISPLSLTYYGLCLKNGKYTVKLHFAEIMFKNYTTYGSPGLRIFDIYIQVPISSTPSQLLHTCLCIHT